MRLYPALVLLFFLISGCTAGWGPGTIDQAIYDQIDIGMSRDRVLAIAGGPAYSGRVDEFEEIVDGKRVWRRKEGQAYLYNDAELIRQFEIIFSYGRVVNKRIKVK